MSSRRASDRLIVVGAGGFGRETLDIVAAHNAAVWHGRPAHGSELWDVVGVVDDRDPDPDLIAPHGVAYLGPISSIERFAGARYIAAVANPVVRARLIADIEPYGLVPATVIHPTAVVGSGLTIAPGSVVCSHVSIGASVSLGRHTQIGANCAVGHDCLVEERVTIYPGAMIGGNVTLCVGVQIGTGAAVIQGLTIGFDTFVGAGAAVVHDLPASVVAVGVPARSRSKEARSSNRSGDDRTFSAQASMGARSAEGWENRD